MENRDKDVENFIGGLVELAGYDTVDGDDNKYIRICSKGDDNGAIESIRTAEGEKPLAIYGSLANDAAIVNPFVEGNSNVALDNWIYTSQNGQLGAIMQSVIRKILESAARTRGKNGKKNEQEQDKYCIPYVGGYVSEITQKTVDEFKAICKNKGFVNIFYKSRDRVGKLNCLLFNPSSKKTYSSVRTSSWPIFQDIFLRLLDIKKLSDLDYSPESPNVPVLESFVSILLRCYERLQEPVEKLLGRKIIGVEALKEHMKNLDAYYQTAKWCISSTVEAPTVDAVTPAASTLPPAIQANLSTPQVNTAVNAGNGLPPAVASNLMAATPVQYQAPVVPVIDDSGLPPSVRANMAAMSGFRPM